MDILNKENKLCTCCMEIHEVITTTIKTKTIFKGKEISYFANCYYCSNADEYFENENMVSQNDIAIKNSYRKSMNLLTSHEIASIRCKYGVSQSDLSNILGWGEKTITRYEGHQVQDVAHDSILRKINDDPEWYIDLLNKSKSIFTNEVYNKYLNVATKLYEGSKDLYLKKSINAQYARFDEIERGNNNLDLNKVVDVVNYFANSKNVSDLYKVKLMKLLWYADALSYKLTNHSITGLVYKSLPMGAVPVAYDSIIDLSGIKYEEASFDDIVRCKFVSSPCKKYKYLTKENIFVLDEVISSLGLLSKNELIDKMHREKAYIDTRPNDIIQYQYSSYLSLSIKK